jgi:hypothetical protein
LSDCLPACRHGTALFPVDDFCETLLELLLKSLKQVEGFFEVGQK